MAIRADVTEADQVDAMVREIEQRWGGVDVLVHNALIPFDVTSFADLTWEQLGGKLDRELHAAFLITKAVVPGMISRGYGRMVYLSTGLSRRPRDGMITLGTARRHWTSSSGTSHSSWRRTGSPRTSSRRPRSTKRR